MTSWYSIALGEFDIKYTPLKVKSELPPLTDKTGKPIKKKYGNSKYVYKDSEQEYTGKLYRKINGEYLENPKYPRTTRVSSKDISIVDLSLSEDLLTEKYMLVDSEELTNHLLNLHQDNKTFAFDFVLREGLSVYLAVLEVEKNGCIVMKLGKGFKSDIIKSILENKPLPSAVTNKTLLKPTSVLKSKFKEVIVPPKKEKPILTQKRAIERKG